MSPDERGAALAGLAVVIIAVGLIGAFWVFLRWSASGRPDPLAPLETAGFQVKRSLWSGNSVSGSHAGVTFEHSVTGGGEGDPPLFVVTIPASVPSRFSIEPASGITWRSFVSQPFKTGDKTFDEKYSVFGDAQYLSAMLDSQNKERLRKLLGGRCNEVIKQVDTLTVRGPGKDLLPLEELKAVVEQLAALRLPSP